MAVLHDVQDAVLAGNGRHLQAERVAGLDRGLLAGVARTLSGRNDGNVVGLVARPAPVDLDLRAGHGGFGTTHEGLGLRHRESLLRNGGMAFRHHVEDAVITRLGRHLHAERVTGRDRGLFIRIAWALPGREDGNVVAGLLGPTPRHFDFRTGHGLSRPLHRGLILDHDGQHQALVGLAHDQIALGAGLITQTQHLDPIAPRCQLRAHTAGRIGAEGLRAVLPGDGPDQALVDHGAILLCGGDQLQPHLLRRRRCGLDGANGAQRRAQLGRIVGGEKAPAGGLGHALQLGQARGARIQPEADGVHLEIHAQARQFGHRGAGIGMAGFLAIGHQDHGGAILGVLEHAGGLQHGIGHRGLANRREAIDGAAQGIAFGPDRGDQFNVLAIALAAVAVGHQPKARTGWQFIQQLVHHPLGDGDAGLAIDLGPHRAGGIQHQDGIGRFGRRCLRPAGSSGQ